MASYSPTSALRSLTLAILVGSSGVAVAAVDARASRYYEDALARYEKQDLDGAIIQLKNALQIDNGMLPVHMLLGKALLANGDVAAAEAAFTEALRLGVSRAEVVLPLARAVVAQGRLPDFLVQPRFAPAGLPADVQAQLHLLRASAAADMGDARAALQSIEEARKLDPNSADAWMAEVPVRLRARQQREALAAAERALTLAPRSAEAHYLRGTVAHLQGDTGGALARYGQALQLEPTHVEALVSRAGLLLDLGRFAEAERDAGELARSSPQDPRGHFLRALLAERAGRTAEARAALNQVTAQLDAVPLDYLRYRAQPLILGGLAHFGLNQREKALPYLQAAYRTQPGSGLAKLIARIHLANNNADPAVEVLEGYLKAQPGDAQAMLLLASSQMARGRHARATQLMQDALRADGDRADMRTMLGLSLVGTGRIGDAVSELEAAWRKDPTQLQAGVALATLYLHAGYAAQAQSVAESLAQRYPSSPGVQNLLGTAHLRGGNTAAARRAFEAAAKLDPSFLAPQVNLARLDIEGKSYDAAASRLSTVLSKDDKNTEAMLELARVHELAGRWVEAQRQYERAADLAGPTDLQPALALAEYHLRRRQLEAAREVARILRSRAPESIPVLMAVSRIDLANGDAAAARTNLNRASALASYNPSVLLQVALLQVQAGHLEGAAHSLNKALNERPGFTPAQALLAEVELRQGDVGGAEQRARQIVAQQPKLGVGHGLLGDVALARGQRAAAVEHYRRAHQLDRTTASLVRLHGAIGASDPAAAVRLAEEWLRQRPRDAAVLRAHADALARMGRFADARVAYIALIELVPDDAEALNNLANVLLVLGDASALRVAERALSLGPGVPHIIGTAGWAAFKAGQGDRALQLLRDARLRDPDNPATRYYLAAVLASAARTAEAREELQAALRSPRPFDQSKDAERLLQALR